MDSPGIAQTSHFNGLPNDHRVPVASAQPSGSASFHKVIAALGLGFETGDTDAEQPLKGLAQNMENSASASVSEGSASDSAAIEGDIEELLAPVVPPGTRFAVLANIPETTGPAGIERVFEGMQQNPPIDDSLGRRGQSAQPSSFAFFEHITGTADRSFNNPLFQDAGTNDHATGHFVAASVVSLPDGTTVSAADRPDRTRNDLVLQTLDLPQGNNFRTSDADRPDDQRPQAAGLSNIVASHAQTGSAVSKAMAPPAVPGHPDISGRKDATFVGNTKSLTPQVAIPLAAPGPTAAHPAGQDPHESFLATAFQSKTRQLSYSGHSERQIDPSHSQRNSLTQETGTDAPRSSSAEAGRGGPPPAPYDAFLTTAKIPQIALQTDEPNLDNSRLMPTRSGGFTSPLEVGNHLLHPVPATRVHPHIDGGTDAKLGQLSSPASAPINFVALTKVIRGEFPLPTRQIGAAWDLPPVGPNPTLPERNTSQAIAAQRMPDVPSVLSAASGNSSASRTEMVSDTALVRSGDPDVSAAPQNVRPDLASWRQTVARQALPLNGTVVWSTGLQPNRPEIQPLEFTAIGSGLPDARTVGTPPAITVIPGSMAQQATAIVQQLVQVTGQLGHGPVELSLSPEELGRVRMTLTPAESGMVLSVFADREETLALLRRNIELLSNDLRDLGYTNLSFEFGSGGSGTGQRESAPDRTAKAATLDLPELAVFSQKTQATPRPANERLDLRL